MKHSRSVKRGARLPDPLVEEHVEAINARWLKHGEIDNEVAVACHRANVALDAPAKKQLMKRLLFSEPKFSKFAAIGGDARLLDPKRAHIVPKSPSIKYELHQLDDHEFDQFEAEGRLTPTVRRAEVIDWRRKKRGEPPPSTTPAPLPGRFYVALKPNRQLAQSEEEKIDSVLTEVAERYEMDVVYSEGKLRLGVYEKAEARMRRETKKVVAEAVRFRRKKYGPHAFDSKPELKKYAGLIREECEITTNSDQEEMLAVLTANGREDEFERIRKEAYDEYDVGAPYETPKWVTDVADRLPPKEALAEDAEQIRKTFDAYRKGRSMAEIKARLNGVK